MKLPYINLRLHLAAMMETYDKHAEAFNAEIDAKRRDNPAEATKYQTLKPTHRSLFKDLIIETGHIMLKHIRNHEKLQAEQANGGLSSLLSNPFCGNGYYLCITNRYQLSKHNKKELSTIYRNLKRLNEAGILLSTNAPGAKNKFTVFHGQKNDFELIIDAKFLIVSDKANPEYNPLASPKIAKCNEEEKEKEQLKNKINSAEADLNTTVSTQFDSTTRTITRTEGVRNSANLDDNSVQRSFKPTGGAVDVQFMKRDRGLLGGRLDKVANPVQWHAYHRLSFAAMFIDYLIEKIYDRRGMVIIPEARLKAIEYAEAHYFPAPGTTREAVKTIFHPCDSVNDYVNRLNGLKWCIDAANRFAARKNAYFMMINRYIDMNDTPNGFIKTLEWYKNAKFNEKEKLRHAKNIKDLRKLNELTRTVFENPTFENYQKAENFVENNLQKYAWVFRKSTATILTEIKQLNN